jgi:glutamyl-tRNA synthetase
MGVTARFAPSPTGRLHAGNIRTALFNYLYARKTGGSLILRLDDTDTERSTAEFARGIEEDLHWLGIDWAKQVRQSDRFALYAAAVEKLKASGRLYPAYETPEELELKRKRQLARGKPPVYDRAALKLTAEDRAKLEAEGRKPHWRFRLSQTKVKWRDLVRGDVEIDTAHLSDPVLIREDGRFLYTLPSVVDDIDFAVTHIIRGEDHVTNTAAQIEIFNALGATPPHFAHFPLLVGVGGEALSKRIGSLSLREIRDGGIEPMALNCYLAKTGTSDAIELRPSLEALTAEFDFAKIGRAPARFDPKELEGLNAKWLHALPYDAVKDRLSLLGIDSEALWNAIKPNVARLSDAGDLAALVTGKVAPVIENAAFAQKAADLLPPEPWDENTWGAWTKAVSAATGAKGRDLFHPLRLALTARESGPEMKKLLSLMGRAKTLARLKGEMA